MKNILLCTHLMPWELNNYNIAISQIFQKYIPIENIDLSICVELNLSDYIIDWTSSKVSKSEIVNKFNNIIDSLPHDSKIGHIVYTKKDYGFLNAIDNIFKLNYDGIIGMCPDIVCNNDILSNLLAAISKIQNEYCCIIPQGYYGPIIPQFGDSIIKICPLIDILH